MKVRLYSPCSKFKRTNKADHQVDLTELLQGTFLHGTDLSEEKIEILTVLVKMRLYKSKMAIRWNVNLFG